MTSIISITQSISISMSSSTIKSYDWSWNTICYLKNRVKHCASLKEKSYWRRDSQVYLNVSMTWFLGNSYFLVFLNLAILLKITLIKQKGSVSVCLWSLPICTERNRCITDTAICWLPYSLDIPRNCSP